MLTRKSFLCLDLGSSGVKAAEFELTHGELSLKSFGSQRFTSPTLQDSKRVEAVRAAIADIAKAQRMRAREANVSLTGAQVFSKIVKLPAVDNAKVKQIIQYEAQQNIPFPIEQAVWDFQILGAAPSGELEVMLLATRHEAIEELFQVADARGLKVDVVDTAPTALANAFRYNYGDPETCVMLIDVGARASNIIVFEKGRVFFRTVNIGANAITQEFAAEIKTTFAKAEQLKVAEGSVALGGAYEEPENPNEAIISKIARQVFTRLHVQVNQTIQFYRGQMGGSAPVRVYLAGGGASLPYTTEFFAEKLNVPVEYLDALKNVELHPDVDTMQVTNHAHEMGELVGLALRNMAQCPLEVNLIPKSLRVRQELGAKKPFFFATVASIVVTIMAYGFFYDRVTAVKRDALATMKPALEKLEARAAELDKQEKLITNAKTEADVYTGYLRDRYFWPEALVEMRNILTRVEDKLGGQKDVGVWIESFGAVDATDDEMAESTPQQANNPYELIHGMPAWLVRNPIYFQRLYPDLFKTFQDKGWLAEAQNVVAARPQTNTNLVTIDVKFRAVSLNNPNDPAANGRLAFEVAEAFKKSGLFDPNGTRLSGELQEPEMISPNFGTFKFAMTLKLKNEMQL